MGDDESIGNEEFLFGMPKGDIVDEKRGSEIWFAMGPITGVEGAPANGVAQAHYFDSGVFFHTAQINIESPEEGFFHEGWLVNPETKEVISTGHLRSLMGDTRHRLQFESDRDLRAFSKVVVTLEPDDGNPAPASHVAEGIFRVVER